MRRREDEPDAGFYAAGGLSAAETIAQARDNVARLLTSIVEHGRDQPPITPARIRAWHLAIFGRLFPQEAGRWRRPHEEVAFPVLVEEDGRLEPIIVTGAPAETIEDAVASACDRLERALRAAERGSRPDVDEAASELAEFMGEVLRVHPFVDGNHRVVLVAAQAVFARLTGRLLLWGERYEALEEALELAIVGGDDRRPLVDVVARRLADALPPPP